MYTCLQRASACLITVNSAKILNICKQRISAALSAAFDCCKVLSKALCDLLNKPNLHHSISFFQNDIHLILFRYSYTKCSIRQSFLCPICALAPSASLSLVGIICMTAPAYLNSYVHFIAICRWGVLENGYPC